MEGCVPLYSHASGSSLSGAIGFLLLLLLSGCSLGCLPVAPLVNTPRPHRCFCGLHIHLWTALDKDDIAVMKAYVSLCCITLVYSYPLLLHDRLTASLARDACLRHLSPLLLSPFLHGVNTAGHWRLYQGHQDNGKGHSGCFEAGQRDERLVVCCHCLAARVFFSNLLHILWLNNLLALRFIGRN